MCSVNKNLAKLLMTFLTAIILATSAYADTKEWVVVKMSGDVWVKSEQHQKVALSKGQSVKLGTKLITGIEGRVLLKRGQETIMLFPNTQIVVPKKSADVEKTKIYHYYGKVSLDVEKKNVKHFSVETPYLVAIVKGTKFDISITQKGAKVNVISGKVEVKNRKSGRYALIQPGQTASVLPSFNGKRVLNITGKGVLPKIQQGRKTAPIITPIKPPSEAQLQSAQKVNKNQKDQKQTGFRVKPRDRMFTKQQDKKTKLKKRAKRLKNKGLTQKAKTAKRIKRKRRKFRIGRTMGVVKLNLAMTTKGLARSSYRPTRKSKYKKRARNKSKEIKQATFWSLQSGKMQNRGINQEKFQIVGNRNGNGNGNGFGNGNNGSNNNFLTNNANTLTAGSSITMAALTSGGGTPPPSSSSGHTSWWILLLIYLHNKYGNH